MALRLWHWLAGGTAGALAEELRRRVEAEAGMLRPLARPGWQRVVGALAGLPRPVMAGGTFALVTAAILAPDWFAQRMQALASLPEPLWWLIGAALPLVFGARYQASEQAFARELLQAAPGSEVVATAGTGSDAALTLAVEAPQDNPALRDWLAGAGESAAAAAGDP